MRREPCLGSYQKPHEGECNAPQNGPNPVNAELNKHSRRRFLTSTTGAKIKTEGKLGGPKKCSFKSWAPELKHLGPTDLDQAWKLANVELGKRDLLSFNFVKKGSKSRLFIAEIIKSFPAPSLEIEMPTEAWEKRSLPQPLLFHNMFGTQAYK